MNNNPRLICCSFCGKSEQEVHRLIAGPSVFICNECIDLDHEILPAELNQEREDETV